MTASVLKQDPNTKRFKRTLIYFDTESQYPVFLCVRVVINKRSFEKKMCLGLQKNNALFTFSTQIYNQ